MSNGLIINIAPTGMIPTKEMTRAVPVTPAEIVEDVLEACELGANMAHVHARDSATGLPTHEKDVYAAIIRGIRRKNKDLVICVSTSGRDSSEFEKRSAVLELEGDAKPDFASLTLSSLNFNKQASINSPDMIQALAAKMAERGIRPELEVFDLGMINYAKYLVRKRLLTPPYYFNLILGNIACAQASLLNLGLMTMELPDGALWSAGGVGRVQLKANAMAIVEGGGVRVGLEDNIWYDEERTRLASNRDMVKRVVEIAGALGRKPYSCSEARKLLGV